MNNEIKHFWYTVRPIVRPSIELYFLNSKDHLGSCISCDSSVEPSSCMCQNNEDFLSTNEKVMAFPIF